MADIFDTLAAPQEDVFDALAPAPVVPAERGLVGETVAGFKRGGLQLVDMAGNIARAVDPEGGMDVVRNAGLGFSKFAKARALQPDVAESSYVENNPILGNIPKAAEMVLPSVGVPLAIGAGAAAAGFSSPVLAAGLGTGALFGLSQFQDTKERGLEKGLTESEANVAGLKTGVIEGGGEAIGNVVVGATLGLGKPLAGAAAKSLLKMFTTKEALKESAKTLTRNAAQIMTGEVSTEMAQAYTQGLTEKNAGIRPDADPWQEAKDVIGPTIALSLMLGGVVGGANKLSKVATERALTNAGAGEDVRRQAADNVHQGILQAEQDGSAPAGAAENFRINADEAIKNKAPLTLSDELLMPHVVTSEADLFATTVDVPVEAAVANVMDKVINGDAETFGDAFDQHNAEVADLKNELNVVRDDQLAEALNLEEQVPLTPLPESAPSGGSLSTPLSTPVENVDPETGEIVTTPQITDPLDAYRGYASEKSATKARGGVPEGHEVVQRPSDGLWVRRPKESTGEVRAPDTTGETPITTEPAAPTITPNQVRGSISIYNVDEVSALGYDSETAVYTLREKGPDGPVDVATYEVIGGKVQNFKTDATARDGFDREQQIQEAQSLVEKIEKGRSDVNSSERGGVADSLQGRRSAVAGSAEVNSRLPDQSDQKGTPDTVEGRALVESSIKRSIAKYTGGSVESVSISLVPNVGSYKVANSIARLFGKYVYTADTQGDKSLGDAFVSSNHPDAIFISKNTDKPVLSLLGHELTHKLVVESPALYNELKLYIEATNKSELAKKYKGELKNIAQYKNLSESDITEEYIGNVVGHLFTQQSFWEKMAQKEPNLFMRVIIVLRDMLHTIKSNFQGAASTLKDVSEVETVTAKVLTKYARLHAEGRFMTGATGEGVKFLSAWHGSPHDFEKFRTAHIGTGEGAQAYGYGLYFAGNREVAEYYKEALSKGNKATASQTRKADGERVSEIAGRLGVSQKDADRVIVARDQAGNWIQAEKALRNPAVGVWNDGMFELINALKGKELKYENDMQGKLYQVELAPSEDEYLLWDKPLSEQSEKVKTAFKAASENINPFKETPDSYEKLNRFYEDFESDNQTGRQIYQTLEEWVLESDKAASEYLHSLGIRGIKYLDGTSRSVKDTVPTDFMDRNEASAYKKFDGDVEKAADFLVSFIHDTPKAKAKDRANFVTAMKDAEKRSAKENLKPINYNYVIFSDEDVSITMKFSAVDATKSVNSFFKNIPYGQILTDLSNKAYRFLMPVDRAVTLAASQKTFAPIKSLLNQFIRQRKEKAGRIQSDMTDGAHIWKRFEKHFKTDAEIQNFTDMVWNATEYELHADGAASGWTEKSWEEAGMLERTGKSLGQAKKIVSDQYKKLSPEQKVVHQEMLHHVQQMYLAGRQAELAWLDQAKVKEAEAWLLNEEGEKPELADLVKEVNEHYPTLRGDYMPLMRFGNLIVRTYEQDENGELGARTRTEFFSSPQEAKAYVEGANADSAAYHKALKAAGKDVQAIAAVREQYKDVKFKHAKIETNPEYRKDVVNIPASLVDKISKAAEKQGITGEALEDLKQSIEGIRANMLPRNSIASSKLHREGVAGYEKDVIRVYLTYVRNHALANAQLTHGAKIEQTFRDMRNTIDSISSEPDYDVDAVRRMSELADHLYDVEKSGSREKVNEFTKTVGKITFMWYLSSPSVFAVQWSQPFMVTIPKMGARHGFGKAFAAYTQAAKRFLHGDFSDDKIDAFDRSHQYVGQRVADILDRSRDAKGAERKQLDAELKAIYDGFKDQKEKRLLILKVLSHQGQIDLAMAHNAQDIVAGANAGDKIINKVVDKAAFFMQKSETGSRRAAAVAAFELQFNGTNFTEANDYATHIISDTLMDFDAQNRGAAWRGNTGRILGQFQFFRMHMMGKLLQLTKDAIGGEYDRAIAEAKTEEEKVAARTAKREARKELAYVMGSSFALAGAAGTPVAMLLSNTAMSGLWGALSFLFGDDDDPWDPQREFELAMREALGDTVGNVVLKGLPSLVGADISRRIGLGGMGDVISGEPPAGLTGTAKANWYAGRILGPSWGMVSDTMRASDALAEGDLAAAVRYSSPKVMRDVVKMFNVADEGIKGGGKTLVAPEDVSVWSMALMLSGINPTEVSLAQDESRYLKNISTELSQRRSLLIRHLAEATVEQDLEGKESAIEKINKWSETNPSLKITQQEVVQKIKKVRDGQSGKLSKREALIQGEFGKK